MKDTTLSRVVVQKLMSILSVNPYAKVLKCLQEIPLDSCEVRIRSDAHLDRRVYNCPTQDQVAAIWVEGSNPNVPHERDIVVHAQSGQRHRVKHYFGCYDPL